MVTEDEDLLRARANVGRVLSGKWTLEKVIGVGGMAAVFSATHRTGSRVAIKMLHPDLAHHEEVRQRFLREAYIANSIGHEGVVAVIDDDQDESGAPYIVMELLNGKSVATLVKDAGGMLPVHEVLRIADAALAVLEPAHAKGIVHRDLKPDNLFVTDKNVVKMLDFGIARAKEASGDNKRTKTGMLMGTPSFMAPEQALGRTKDIDGSTDQWAIGATMFNLLSGHDVHEAASDNELIIYAATRPARSLAEVLPDAPPEVVEIVDRSLQYDRVKRYPDVTAMREALRPLLAQHAGAARAPDGEAKEAKPKTTLKKPGTPANKTAVDATSPDELDLDQEDYGTDLSGARELFSSFEKAVHAKHQYGPNHPEALRRLEGFYQKAMEELNRRDAGLAVNVNPYSFFIGEETLWEPKTPLDEIPYRLFADGVRLIGFLQGVGQEELAKFLSILMADPVKDIPPGENLLTMIWDANFAHIMVEEVDAFAEGDQAARQRFEAERGQILQIARIDTSGALSAAWKDKEGAKQSGALKHQSLVQKVNSKISKIDDSRIATMRTFGDRRAADQAALGGALSPADSLKIDEATRAILAAKLTADMSAVGERFVLAAASAFLFAAKQGKPQAVTAALRVAVENLAKDSAGDAIDFVAALCRAVETPNPVETEQLRGVFAGHLVSHDTMKRLLDSAASPTADLVRGLATILNYIDATHLTSVLEFLRVNPTTALLETCLRYVQKVALDHEDDLGHLLAVADTELALSILRLLSGMSSAAARTAAGNATKNPNALVRIEALGQMEGASSERLRTELRRLLEDAQPEVRVAALQQMARGKIKIVGPFLVLRIKSPMFDKLSIEERKQAFTTLVELAPTRAEAVALELVQAKSSGGGIGKLIGMGGGESETKVLAIDVLGQVGSSGQVQEALSALARGGMFSNDKVKERAMIAMQSVILRQAQPAQPKRPA